MAFYDPGALPSLSVLVTVREGVDPSSEIGGILSSASQAGESIEVIALAASGGRRVRAAVQACGARWVDGSGQTVEETLDQAVRASSAYAIALLGAGAQWHAGAVAELLGYAYDGGYLGGRLLGRAPTHSLSPRAWASWAVGGRERAAGLWFTRDGWTGACGFAAPAAGSDFPSRLGLLAAQRGKRLADLRLLSIASGGSPSPALLPAGPTGTSRHDRPHRAFSGVLPRS